MSRTGRFFVTDPHNLRSVCAILMQRRILKPFQFDHPKACAPLIMFTPRHLQYYRDLKISALDEWNRAAACGQGLDLL
ncbi:MAG: hypothetical protein ACI9NT_000425 [Bacteroidia bacterium]|jgi:hypothetical protein